MKMMCLLFLSLILLTNCKNNEPERIVESNLVFEVTFKGGCFNPYADKSEAYFLVEAKLVNETNKVFEFVVYCCTTASCIVTNSDDIVPLPVACSANYPIIIELKPNHEFVMPLLLYNKGNNNIDYDTIKLGIILIKPEDIKDFMDVHDKLQSCRESHKNVLWSDDNWLYRINGKSFEVRTIPDSTYYLY